MPIVKADQTAVFNLPGAVFTAMAAPSRGSVRNCVWRVTLSPESAGTEHHLDQEEIFVALAGQAVATLGGVHVEVRAGDTLIVPAHAAFALANPGTEPFEALAVAPVGVRATLKSATESFCPPWTQ